MRRISLLGIVMTFLGACAPALAQVRPGAFTTVQATSTGAGVLTVGCGVGTLTGCTGGINAGAPVFNGIVTSNGFGTNSFSGGGVGANTISLANTTAGTGNYARYSLGNDVATPEAYWDLYSSTYSTSGRQVANGILIENALAGGVSLSAVNGSGTIRFYAGGATERGRMHASGGFSWGSTTDPGASTVGFYQQANFSYVARSAEMVYGPANTDGFMLGTGQYAGSGGSCITQILADASNPPSTARAQAVMRTGGGEQASIMVPIPKGWYYELDVQGSAMCAAAAITYWVPNGTHP